MKKSLIFIALIFALASCHESLENRAAREAKEYTEKFCPTPVENFTRTDSIVFDKTTKTYHYYCTLTDKMDNPAIINKNWKKLNHDLAKSISESTNIKAYKDAGFNFSYTCHSQKDPKRVLFEATYTPKDYK